MSSIFMKFVSTPKVKAVVDPIKSREEKLMESTGLTREEVRILLTKMGYHRPPDYIKDELSENTAGGKGK